MQFPTLVPRIDYTAEDLGFDDPRFNILVHVDEGTHKISVDVTDPFYFHKKLGSEVAQRITSDNQDVWLPALGALESVIEDKYPGSVVDVALKDEDDSLNDAQLVFSVEFEQGEDDRVHDFLLYLFNATDPGSFGTEYIFTSAKKYLP